MTSNATKERGSSKPRGFATLGTLAAAQLLRVLPRAQISRAVGFLCDLELPAPLCRTVVGLYASAFGVDLDEAEGTGNGAYPSFDAFFTRKLRTGVRAAPSDPQILASPSDGRLEDSGAVDTDGVIHVKGQPYHASELLLSDDEAIRYRGGHYAVLYLSPRDYHRLHAPTAGRIVEVRSAPGDLFPVNAIGQHIPKLLVRNRRVAITIDTDRFGRVTVVMVAAMFVGRITVAGVGGRDVPPGVHGLNMPIELAAGDELGIFHLGSTAVLFLEPRALRRWDRDIGPVHVGDALGVARLGTREEDMRRGGDLDD